MYTNLQNFTPVHRVERNLFILQHNIAAVYRTFSRTADFRRHHKTVKLYKI